MIKSYEGTLAGVAVPLALDGRIRSLSIKNDDTANTYTCSLGGETITVKAGEERRFDMGDSQYGSLTINGTGDYRILASDSEVPPTIDPATAGTIGLVDGSVTTVKLADAVLSADAAGRLKMATGYFNAAAALDKFAAAAIPGSRIAADLTPAVLGNTTDLSTAGQCPIVYAIPVAGGPQTVNVLVARKVRVIDVHTRLEGGGAGASSTTVSNAGAAITDVMSTIAGGNRDVIRAAEIDAANQTIAAGAALRVATIDAGSPAQTVYVIALPVT